MRDAAKRFLWVSVYAIAMAYLEAVVVAYIRALLRITEDSVSLGPYAQMEIGREAATILMLVAVGWLAGRHGKERWAYGLFAFGLWDIFYYAWLKLLLGWPETLLDWDILFLIPLRWWGPVLAPVLIAALICVTTVMAVVRMERGRRLGITYPRVGIATLGVLLTLYTFMSDALHAFLSGQSDWTMRPSPFPWGVFLVAYGLIAVPLLAATWPAVRSRPVATLEADG